MHNETPRKGLTSRNLVTKHEPNVATMEGRLDVFPESAKRKLVDLMRRAREDKYAEIEVRFGKIVHTPRYRFDTDIGKRAIKHIVVLLSLFKKWKDKSRIENSDAFYTHANGRKFRVTTMPSGEKVAVEKIKRECVDIELPNMPFDIRVAYSSEIPVNVDEVSAGVVPGDAYVRKKRRDRFNSRDTFYYDATKVTTETEFGFEDPRYEFEIEMDKIKFYVDNRGVKTAVDSLLLKALDIQKMFM